MIELPDLSSAPCIAVDLETSDPSLLTHGCGGARGDGHIAGIAVGVPDGGRWYIPMRQEGGGQNIDPEKALEWARVELGRAHQPKIGASIIYDLEWLKAEGVDVAGKFVDVQYAEALLDESAKSYSLDSLGEKYLGEGKTDDALYAWLANAYGGQPTRKAQGGRIHLAPVDLVSEYAKGDVDLPLRIWEKQQPLLAAEGLTDLADIEFRLIPMLLAMRMNGVRVDIERAKRLDSAWGAKVETARRALPETDVWAAASVAQLFDRLGIEYPYTAPSKNYPKGQPSFTQAFITATRKTNPHPQLEALYQLRHYEKILTTFIRGGILDKQVSGRLHGSFNPLKATDFGTVSGRFSCNNPNLQNLPARDEEIGPEVRGIFIPDNDAHEWLRYDYSQIEFRLCAHYGGGESADAARAKYNDDPTTDFHAMVSEMTGVARKSAKSINFGLVYGMGEPKLSRQLGITIEEARPIFKQYHTALPFVRDLFKAATNRAEERGYVRTLLGRRRRFNKWQGRQWNPTEAPMTLEEAQAKYGRIIRRAETNKALNAVLQGGSADIIKKSMVEIWDSGVCAVLGPPLMTIHDELDFSKPKTKEADQAALEVKRIMENTVKLSIPLVVDMLTGAHWGECK